MTTQQLSQIIFSRLLNAPTFSQRIGHLDHEVVVAACDEEAEFQGTDMEELGSSDISCMARSVLRRLGVENIGWTDANGRYVTDGMLVNQALSAALGGAQ